MGMLIAVHGEMADAVTVNECAAALAFNIKLSIAHRHIRVNGLRAGKWYRVRSIGPDPLNKLSLTRQHIPRVGRGGKSHQSAPPDRTGNRTCTSFCRFHLYALSRDCACHLVLLVAAGNDVFLHRLQYRSISSASSVLGPVVTLQVANPREKDIEEGQVASKIASKITIAKKGDIPWPWQAFLLGLQAQHLHVAPALGDPLRQEGPMQ